MLYVIKSIIDDKYIVFGFCPLEVKELTDDVNKATKWKDKECADIIANEFYNVEVVEMEDK